MPNVGKDIPLSYEGLIHKTAELEAVLEPTINYNADLELELEREKARLATDEARLAQLQTNAKSQERARAEQLRMVRGTVWIYPDGAEIDVSPSSRAPYGRIQKAGTTAPTLSGRAYPPDCRGRRRTTPRPTERYLASRRSCISISKACRQILAAWAKFQTLSSVDRRRWRRCCCGAGPG